MEIICSFFKKCFLLLPFGVGHCVPNCPRCMGAPREDGNDHHHHQQSALRPDWGWEGGGQPLGEGPWDTFSLWSPVGDKAWRAEPEEKWWGQGIPEQINRGGKAEGAGNRSGVGTAGEGEEGGIGPFKEAHLGWRARDRTQVGRRPGGSGAQGSLFPGQPRISACPLTRDTTGGRITSPSCSREEPEVPRRRQGSSCVRQSMCW